MKTNLLVLITTLLLFIGCKEEPEYNIAIIPKPLQLVQGIGDFEFNRKTKVFIEDSAKVFNGVEDIFQSELLAVTGYKPEISETKPNRNYIVIQLEENLESEAYMLDVTPQNIIIRASSASGAFYALQTIKQLFPIGFASIPAVHISDKPAFGWRGYMLDVSRHFYGKEDVKRVLDFMAELKLNRFHWHLADDQGWRVEIKKYPKLTEVGAWRVDYNIYDETISNWWGRPVQIEGDTATYGGFYTQEDIKEIVAYAKERYIEILPEIDIPGHSQEILASYPEVSCDGRKYYVATGGVYKDNALCASRKETYKFVGEVLGEVMDMFPFNYIHIGGDECNKEGWMKHEGCQQFMKAKRLKNEHELQSYFIKQVEKIVNAKGKNMIGWDEILEGGLAPNATVMSWRGEKGGIAAAKAGHNVIMTPNYANYLDLKQGQSKSEPNLGYSEALLSACYNYSVIPKELTQKQAKHVLGLQGNLWTESISDWGKLTYMTFPRLFAVAENGWTPEENQGFDEFMDRLSVRLARLDDKKVRYAKSVFNVWIHQKGIGNKIEISLGSELHNPDIRYTLDGSTPKANSQKYFGPFVLSTTETIKTAIFKNGKMRGRVTEATYPIHKAAGAKVIYHNIYSRRDRAAGNTALTDLNYGQLGVKGDMNWQGFGEELDVEIVLPAPTNVKSVTLTSLRMTIGGVYPPGRIDILGSVDGKRYSIIGQSGYLEYSLVQGRNKIKSEIPCKARNIKNLRIKAKTLNPIPEGHHKAGKRGYLKIDEIIVL
jgi:hexosaminidase